MTDLKKRAFIKYASYSALAGASGLLWGCGESDKGDSSANTTTAPESSTAVAGTEPLKVGFVYIGPVGDGGWSFSHDQGRKHIVNVFGDKIQTSFVESVQEADSERVFRDLVDQGNKIIFGATFGYAEHMMRVAAENPDVYFEHCTGYQTAPNLRVYDHRLYEAAFQAGVAAAHLTKTKILGFVGTYPIPEVRRNVNAYTLGARSVDPEIVVKTVMVNSWYNPSQETINANALIDNGADVILQNTDSSAVLQATEKRGKLGFGWDSDMSRYAPNAHLASCVLNWGVYYEKAINDVLNGTWKTDSVRWGAKEGLVEFGHMSDKIQGRAKERLNEVQAGLLDGSFNVFKGPILDTDGKERLAEGQVADADWESKVDFFVEGVQTSSNQ